MIESMAFCNCDFGAVAFGALRLVGENPFYKCNTDWIRLGLSYEQAEMKLDETAQKWVPTEKNTGTYMTKETKVFLALHLRKYRIRNN
ncbi:hypothetical protein [Prevotella merdae]|uniref:hypothetical protein n=1 Tax=Prevotella merdae TaxID=2079531 RepID=UPI00356169FC